MVPLLAGSMLGQGIPSLGSTPASATDPDHSVFLYPLYLIHPMCVSPVPGAVKGEWQMSMGPDAMQTCNPHQPTIHCWEPYRLPLHPARGANLEREIGMPCSEMLCSQHIRYVQLTAGSLDPWVLTAALPLPARGSVHSLVHSVALAESLPCVEHWC